MYQTVGHQAIELYADAMSLPLYRRIISGSPIEQGSNYSENTEDEVEDLYELLKEVKVSVLRKCQCCIIKIKIVPEHNISSVNPIYRSTSILFLSHRPDIPDCAHGSFVNKGACFR